MLFCRETGCLGWSLSPSDQFCAWCGARLVEINISFESKFGEEWVPLSPPVLNRERPPALRLRISHEGEAGSFPIQQQQLICSAPWLGFDLSKISDARLHAGETVYLPVNRLKVPGKEDSFHEAKIQLSAAPSSSAMKGDVGQAMVGKVTLSFVPPPRFQMELETTEVLLSSEGAPGIDGTLLLERGRVWLESPPRLMGDWATLQLLDEDPENPLRFPLELDGRDKPRLSFRIHFGAEHINDIRVTGAENPTALRRNNKLVMTCRDRGMRSPGAPPADTSDPSLQPALGGEALKVELPLQLNFILAPEVHLTPFTAGSRAEWHVTIDGDDHQPIHLRLSNGPPRTEAGAAPANHGRQELMIRQVSLRVRQSELEKCFSLESPRPTPWKVAAGESVDFSLRFLASKAPAGFVEAATSIELMVVSNDPIPRSFFFDFRALRPQLFPGWLVIDLGTSNTCAALVDENRAITLVPFEGSREGRANEQLASAVCYLRLRRECELEFGQRAVERSREPSATRAVVLAAKRRIGHPDHPYHITPLDEPGETLPRSAEEVVQDLYLHVISQATRLLLEAGRQDIIISRLAITHPSRFSVTQIGHLKRSACLALEQHLRNYPAEAVASADPQTLHEPIGAALHFLNDWRQQAHLFEEWSPRIRVDASTQILDYHLFVFDFGGGTLDMTLIRVQAQRQPLRHPEEAEHAYSYTILPQVLGAMGERWFGGQDVTRELVDLLRQRLGEQAKLLWPAAAGASSPRQPGALSEAARNEALLTAWAEELKIALVEGQELEELLLSLPSLYFEEDGKDKLVSSSSLRRSLRLPELEELQARIRPLLSDSLKRAGRLIARHGLEKPDVVLQVGQSCRLPAVEETLVQYFPEALHLRSASPKACVVQGAATTVFPGVSAGVQLSRGIDRPSLRLKLAKDQSLSATTSRLGIKVLDGGKAWFQEVLGEGLPIPREGLRGSLEGVVLETGANVITLLENCGHRDELVLHGQPNREILEVREVRFELSKPGDVQASELEDCQLRFTMSQDLTLTVELRAGPPGGGGPAGVIALGPPEGGNVGPPRPREDGQEWLELARLSSQEFGGHY